MLKKIATALSLVALTSTTAMAAKAPWESARPANMTAALDKMAASAKKAYDRVGPKGFDDAGVKKAKWGWRNNRNENFPLSNMNSAQLNALFVGNYHIYNHASNKGKDAWTVEYHGSNGRTYRCFIDGSKVKEADMGRYVDQSEAGFHGFAFDDEKKKANLNDWAWPMIGNPSTGEVAYWTTPRGSNKWTGFVGFVQKEIPAIAVQLCPGLPKNAKVNEAQNGKTYSSMEASARKIKGFSTSFQSSAKNPLTLGMFYWAYPPSD